MSEIQAGDGWRLLRPDEVVRDGDEPWHRFEKRWMQIPMDVPYTAKAYPAVRRRIPAKPESIAMMDYRGIIAVTGMPETVTIEQVFYGEQSDFVVIETVQNARQLADWLTRYADWREVQDAGK
jgi:hypothetical protein